MNTRPYKRALLLSAGLLITIIISCIVLWIRSTDDSEQYTAYIYQDGKLLECIDLSSVQNPYTLTISTSDGGYNEILVQTGGIAVASANCPDRVCVHQGTIRNSLLPITCLPHGLVIELKATNNNIDTITY